MEELFLIYLSLFGLLPGSRKISGLHTLTGGRTGIRKETFKEPSVNKNSYLHLRALNYLH